MVTLKEIAGAAGVSVSTVSRIVNGRNLDGYSRETVRKVLAIAQTKGYKSRSLTTDGLRAADVKSVDYLITARNTGLSQPVYLPLISGLETALRMFGLAVENRLWLYDQDSQVLWEPLEECLRKRHHLIVIGTPQDQEVARRIAEQRDRVVVVYGNMWAQEVDSVQEDDLGAMERLVAYLKQKGYRKLLLLEGIPRDHRSVAFINAMQSNGLPLAPEQILTTYYDPQRGYEKMTQALLQKDFDAVVAASDMLAAAAIKAVSDAGLEVPKDVAVTGYGDTELARFLIPALTTVSIQLEEMGKAAARLLYERITGMREIPVRLITPARLVPRASA